MNNGCDVSGMMYVNGYDHPNILAGQGTMGLEILDQVPDVDAIVIPVGGGGLIAGVALAVKTMKPDVTIIGVEPEACPSFSTALKAGKPVQTPTDASLADGKESPHTILALPKLNATSFFLPFRSDCAHSWCQCSGHRRSSH